MRKKLFAVIMSAMMMITFMPAMAFAGTNPDPTSDADVAKAAYGELAWYVSDFTTPFKENRFGYAEASFTYDAKEHSVMWNIPSAKTLENGATVQRYDLYKTFAADGTPTGTPVKSTEAPKLKDAGEYAVKAYVGYYTTVNRTKVWTVGEHLIYVTIHERPIAIQGFGTLEKTKVYDGKGFTLTDKDFTVIPVIDSTTGKEMANSGLVAGDTLLKSTITTAADVGVYDITTWNVLNPNYTLYTFVDGKYTEASKSYGTKGIAKFVTLRITKAANSVVAPVTHRAKKAGQKFSLNAKAKFGDVKVTKVQGSKYLKVSGKKILVKSNAKKGSYKIKVKVYVDGNNNYNSASLTKWVYVKVQ